MGGAGGTFRCLWEFVKAFPSEKIGERTLVQINARDDYIVEKKSGEKRPLGAVFH